MKIALAQIAPVWLRRDATLDKVCSYIQQAIDQDCQLVVFGEAMVPGYPFWLERTGGAEFNSDTQKRIFAHYADQAVQIDSGQLDAVCALAKSGQIHVVLGTIERPMDRGGHSLYCSLVNITTEGIIASTHRKLVPTYDERLVWSPGDGNGLQVHRLGGFTLGALNCWENWMPLARAAMYALGEDLHVAIWPGSIRNTQDISRFIAQESRSFVLSCSCIMRPAWIPADLDLPEFDTLRNDTTEFWADGGSCVVGPDGEFDIAPVVGEEALLVAELDHAEVLAERQNFDAAGHYSRPDVTELVVNRQRQSTLRLKGE